VSGARNGRAGAAAGSAIVARMERRGMREKANDRLEDPGFRCAHPGYVARFFGVLHAPLWFFETIAAWRSQSLP
jgi:hypothetical protein